jgi:hypothetical protein
VTHRDRRLVMLAVFAAIAAGTVAVAELVYLAVRALQ